METPSTLNKNITKAMHYDMEGEETILTAEAINSGVFDNFERIGSMYDSDIKDELIDTLTHDFGFKESEMDDEDFDLDDWFNVYLYAVGKEPHEFELIFIEND